MTSIERNGVVGTRDADCKVARKQTFLLDAPVYENPTSHFIHICIKPNALYTF